MKKIILLFVLMLSIKAYSQENEIGTWNEYSEKWVWGEIKEATIPVYISKSGIRLENKSKSYFRTYSDDGEKTTYTKDYVKVTSHSWLSLDNDDKRCRLTMSFMNSEKYAPLVITIMYDDVCIRYYCRKKGLDSLLND